MLFFSPLLLLLFSWLVILLGMIDVEAADVEEEVVEEAQLVWVEGSDLVRYGFRYGGVLGPEFDLESLSIGVEEEDAASAALEV